MNASLSYAGLLGTCVLIEVIYQTTFKVIAGRVTDEQPFIRIFRDPLLWTAIVLWAIEMLLWIAVLHGVDLSEAFPVMALTYAGVPLAGVLALRETMTRKQMIGAGLVLFGVTCVTLGGV